MLRRSLLFALAALCVTAPAFADPGDRGHGRERHWGGDGDHGGPPQGERREDRRGDGQPHHQWNAGEGQQQSGQPEHQGPRPWQDGRRWGPGDAHLRPLGQVIGELQGRFGGRLLGQELANDGGRTIYRIRWMTADGRRLDLVVPADGR